MPAVKPMLNSPILAVNTDRSNASSFARQTTALLWLVITSGRPKWSRRDMHDATT
ncbi:hypothetical protein [Arsukibacterium perlucidum]|uniref:hypothetical protein n=1 Tax=Arsukibacterium perlucidum TaxID=368811 RepID=UPI0012F72DFE|nr:hypothetical protein [Arsukibacterium perlucidum]